MSPPRLRRPFVLALVVASLVDAAHLLLAGAERAVCAFPNTTNEPTPDHSKGDHR